MTKKEMLKEKPLEELKALKQRIVELEALEASYQADEKPNLLEDEQRYRAVFESANDIIILTDKKGKIIDVNKRLKDISGYEREELIGKNITSLARMMIKKSLAVTQSNFLKRVFGVNVPPYEVEMIIKNGESVIIEISAQPLMENDKIVGDLVILRDITERKKVEEALKTSEQNFRNLMDNSTMGIRIRDADEYIVYCNQALLDLFGYKNIEELRASPPQDHYTPASYAGYLLRKGKISRDEPVSNTLEVDIKRKDGTIRSLQVFGKSVFWNGKTQTQTFYNDITERKQAEEALKVSERNFRNSMDGSFMGIYIADTDWHILYVNQAFLDIFGYDNIDEVRASPPHEHYTVEEYARHLVRIERLSRGEPNPDKFELDIVRKDGTIRHLQVFRKKVLWDGKQQSELLYNDITDRTLIEQALKASEENFHNSMDSTLVGIRISDIENHTLYANQALLDIFGYKNIDELKATSPHEYYTPQGYADYLMMKRRLSRGETMPSQAEIDIVRKDGAIRHLQALFKEVFWNGKLQYQTLYNDITERKQAEEALKASEENFRNSMDSSLMGIRIMGDADYTLYANQALLDIFGYKNIDELRASPPQEHYTPESYAGFVRRKEQFSRGESLPDQLEFDIIRTDGDIRHLQLSSKNVFWDGKQQFQLLYNDITERKQAEEALKASEENFRNSIDSSWMGIHIVDKEWHTLYANQAFLDIYGYENIEELQASCQEDRYAPESYASWVVRHEKMIRGESIPNNIDIDIVRKDGATRHLQVFRKEVLWDGKQQYQLLYNDITEPKATEEALRESEEKYRLIVENSQDIIFTLDSAGEFRYVSPSVKQMLGYNQADLIGVPFRSLVHPEDLHIINEAIQHGDEAGHHQYRFRHASGEWRWHASRGTKMLDTGGKSFNFTGISNDITERKQTEEALMLSEQNFRNSIDSSSVGIRISDIENRTLYANQTLLNIFGYKNIDELKSTPPHEYYSPECYADYLKLKERLLRGETMSNQMEIDIVRKDGAIRHLQTLFKEVFWDGKQQYQSIYTDITERKQAERKLQQAAQEWRTTFDSITDLISIHDKDNRIMRVNKAVADMLKTTPNELIGKYCHEVMHGTKEPPANCPHLQTLKTGKPAAIETLNPNLEAYFHESSSPLFNEKGEVTGSIIVARDVTQQKRIEEQLIMTDRLASIGELSSGIAHELNNPLTSVIGFSQLLMEGDIPENIREDLSTVYSEAQRAAAIVKNLLTFARKHAPVKQLTQINSVIEDVLRLRTYEQKVNNIEVEKHFASNLPGIMIDYFQMQQVFLNIVVNAEFAMLETHHKGRLTITTEKVGVVIRITFADDGPGISEENLKHIFDPFFTTKEVGKGTGLGLSICHGVVTEHKGKIYARSENNQGATFVVELPLNGG